MRIPIVSIPYGSSSMMQLRALEGGYFRACDKALESEDVVHLEDMSHSQRIEFLKHDGALRQLQQDKERADLAKAEVTRVLDRVRSIRKDVQGLYKLQLKMTGSTDIMKQNVNNQNKVLIGRIKDLMDSLKASDFYNGSSRAIEISHGYKVNFSSSWVRSSFSDASTLDLLEHTRSTLSKINLFRPGYDFGDKLRYLDVFLIPYLSQDLETCDRAHEVIDAEIKMHKSIISKFYVSQDVRKLQRADAKNRLDSFLMFLWDQMRWSREMMKMMHGTS